MAGLDQSGAYTLDREVRAQNARGGSSRPACCDEAETAATIARHRWNGPASSIDPHTAVGIAVAERHLGATPMVTLATAHPAKFPDAVEAACGVRPELPGLGACDPVARRRTTASARRTRRGGAGDRGATRASHEAVG